MSETSEDLRKRLEREDYGNELAGLDTGRMQRFGVGTARAMAIKEKKQHDRAYQNALDRLLLDQEYRRSYEELGEHLGSAEHQADTAIASIQAQLRLAGEEIAVMESNAARAPDGRLVFQYADGRVVYADGSDVPDQIAEGIIWPDGAPSAEDYFAAIQYRSELKAKLDEWLIYRNDVLGGIRDRYDDPDNPFEDAGALKDALEQIESQAPDAAILGISQNRSSAPVSKPVSLSMIPGELKT